MVEERVQRRLAAILAADVVGLQPADGGGRGRYARAASKPMCGADQRLQSEYLENHLQGLRKTGLPEQ